MMGLQHNVGATFTVAHLQRGGAYCATVGCNVGALPATPRMRSPRWWIIIPMWLPVSHDVCTICGVSLHGRCRPRPYNRAAAPQWWDCNMVRGHFSIFPNMETSLFIETEISKDVEQIAKRREIPVEAIYTIAIKEFIENHKNDGILNSLNEVYSGINSKLDKDIEFAQNSVLNEDW
jgi:hypothetical protein